MVTYTGDSILRDPKALIRSILSDLSVSTQLGWLLAIREFESRYRQAAIGILWAFITPLATSAAWLFIQKTGAINIGETGTPFALYVFTGTVIWSIFSDSVTAPLENATASRLMLAKIKFPLEAVVFSGMFFVGLNGLIRLGIVGIVVLLYGITPTPWMLLTPIALTLLILTGTIIGIVTTPIGLLYTDVARILRLALQIGIYITPVVIPFPKDSFGTQVYAWNPLTPIVTFGRDLMVGTQPTTWFTCTVIGILVLTILSIALPLYRAVMPIVVERISS
jgi:lipopolysaccharide transport system permease protein